jgi:hypothetical protein
MLALIPKRLKMRKNISYRFGVFNPLPEKDRRKTARKISKAP